MRCFLALAKAGCGWLTVCAPDNAAVERMNEIAMCFEAACALRWRRCVNEDLIGGA